MEQMEDLRVPRLMKRRHFTPEDIKYMIHTGQHTQLYLFEGRVVETSMPLKTVAAALPEDQFWSIQKGVVVAARYTVSIDDNNCYTMVDGKQFQGRGRRPMEHRNRRAELKAASLEKTEAQPPMELLAQCALMDNSPLPFCIIELTFADNGHSLDFMYRYCNKAMEPLEERPIEAMLNHSLYQVFPDEDPKWIVPYADVAVNGTPRTVHDYSTVLQKQLTIQCFQPKPGFCACFLTEDGKDY